MSRDTKTKLAITAGTLFVGVALLLAQRMSFSLRQIIAPVGVVAALGPAAMFYQRRETPQFVMSLTAVMFVLVYFSCFTIFMYATASLAFPLIDDSLVAVDAALGIHLPTIVAWSAAHPVLSLVLELVYHSVILQTLAVVLLLGFTDRRVALEGFVLQFLLGMLFTGMIFCIAPAEGPFTQYGFQTSPQQDRYLDHLRTLRSGERTVVSLTDAEGLATFPSFHTTWAILLAFAVRHRRSLFVPSLMLNAVVIAATLTTGWHYATDVLGGAAMAVFVIWLTKRMQPWLYPAAPE